MPSAVSSEKNPLDGKREAGMMVTVGFQGVGKSHQNKIVVSNYAKDKILTKVRGRKALMLDTNGEFAEIDGKPVKKLALKDVAAWCRSSVVEIRRIDMKMLSVDEKLRILKFVLQHVRNILLVLEDINTIALDMSEMKQIVSFLVNLRHKAVDLLISYQSLRIVEPKILQNCRWVRMHYFQGDVLDILGKLNEPELFKIAQIIVNKRYYGGDERFFLYVYNAPPKLKGNFSTEEFLDACKKFLLINKRRINEEMDVTGCTKEQALDNQSKLLYKQFYGNKDRSESVFATKQPAKPEGENNDLVE